VIVTTEAVPPEKLLLRRLILPKTGDVIVGGTISATGVGTSRLSAGLTIGRASITGLALPSVLTSALATVFELALVSGLPLCVNDAKRPQDFMRQAVTALNVD
jgi:hypothetical protein